MEHAVSDGLQITWNGHSCFTLDDGRWSLVIDPYKPAMIGYPPLNVQAHAMLASHQHEDHNYRPSVSFLTAPEDLLLYLDVQDPWPDDAQHIFCKKVETAHDMLQGQKRGSNTVHLIRMAGVTVAHLGDLGHIPDARLAGAIGRPDLLLLPVGGIYTLDAGQAAETVRLLEPRNIAPMHYRFEIGTLPIGPVDPFLDLVQSSYTVRHLVSPNLTLSPDDEGICFVFTYRA